ncbi:MAG TPA: MGMT family protein, partial [Actinomycetaceae bacterium]|nr:MGMT family protein [Actinomycetaceae bacterium]
DLAEAVPRGRVTTYGALAAAARQRTGRGSPRHVGAVMARAGDAVGAWWRVVRADGTLPSALAARARPHYRAEGTPLTSSGAVDVSAAMWEIEDHA